MRLKVQFLLPGGRVLPLKCAVLDKPDLRQQGLMNIQYMPEDFGALFVFDEYAIHRFWMKNTYVPLDIIMIDTSGTIVEIVQGTPKNETFVGSKLSRYAIEVRQGFSDRHGIVPGVKVRW